MRKMLLVAMASVASLASSGQLYNFKAAATDPNANFHTIVSQWRAYLANKQAQFRSGTGTLPENLREEIAQFERWVYNWRDKVDANGKFPSASQGWANMLAYNPNFFNSNAQTARTQASTWTSIGPIDSAYSNGWTYGGGIGRVNAIRKHPTQPILYAGTAAGGIFKSTNMGDNWMPIADNLAGLGISDIVIDPTNPQVIYAATGDFDGGHMSSIGVFKSTDGGDSWNVTGLTFTLSQTYLIAHLAIDPANNQIIYATGRDAIHRSADGGATWTEVYSPGTNFFFNDIVKIGTNWFVSDKSGSIYKSDAAGTTFTQYYNSGRTERLDFAWTAANPDTLYLLSSQNPAFAKLSVSNLHTPTFVNVTNENPGDNSANYNTQNGYNQVIAVSPTHADSIWVGEFSGGKLSIDGGATWKNKLNGYYDPNSTTTNWGGFYVHSDQHDFTFVGSDTLLVGNDGGAYIGKISTNEFKQRFNGLTITQSYSLAIDDAEPQNLMIGNQDNDGMSRIYENGSGKFYGAQAGDGTATAISRNNNQVRYIGSQYGGLSYQTGGFKQQYAGNSITAPSPAIFNWDLQMHATDGSILYGGYTGLYKMTGAPTGTWSLLNTGLSEKVQSITLANNDATTQKIIVIGENNTILKSADETNWSAITPPAGVVFNSIYAKKNNWDTLFATASGYNAANKIFISTDNGVNWTNITKNFPNIQAKKIIAYEGTDTVFIATELGVYFGRVSDATTARVAGPTPWARYGAGLPNVRIEDMEISQAKNQLLVATFGRGVWMANLTNAVLPVNAISFGFKKSAAGSNHLYWKITDADNLKTTLEKSTDGVRFNYVTSFTNDARNNQVSFAVEKESQTVYYRIYYTKTSGEAVYSHTVRINGGVASNMVNVYPNPVKGNLLVSSETELKAVRILTMQGLQVTFARPHANFYTFDMSYLPAGTYLVETTDVHNHTQHHTIVRQ